MHGGLPKHLAWFPLANDQPFEIPFGISPLHHFKILIVPTTAFCMCHSRYCIRILDPHGKVVWINTEIAYAGISVALSASDDGFDHELLIRRYDHGKDARFIVKLNREQNAVQIRGHKLGDRLQIRGQINHKGKMLITN